MMRYYSIFQMLVKFLSGYRFEKSVNFSPATDIDLERQPRQIFSAVRPLKKTEAPAAGAGYRLRPSAGSLRGIVETGKGRCTLLRFRLEPCCFRYYFLTCSRTFSKPVQIFVSRYFILVDAGHR